MNLESLSAEQILKSYELPHRFLVRFACHCAEKALDKSPDPRSVKAVALAKRFGQGEDIAQEELERNDKKAWDAYAASAASAACAARAASSAAAAVGINCSAAAYAAAAASSSAASAASHAAYASSTSAGASPKKRKAFEEELRQELLRMIKAEFSEVEMILRSKR